MSRRIQQLRMGWETSVPTGSPFLPGNPQVPAQVLENKGSLPLHRPSDLKPNPDSPYNLPKQE